MILDGVLIAAQVIGMILLVRVSHPRVSRHVLFRFFNPTCFFVLFTTLFFILPELYGLDHDYFLVGFPDTSAPVLKASFRHGEVSLLLFIVSVLIGAIFARAALKSRSAERAPIIPRQVTRGQLTLLVMFFAIGVLANIYLGSKLTQSGDFRSSLVKSASGKAVTAVALFGGFGTALLVFHAMRARRRVSALLVLGIFSVPVLLTQARGRLLWPLAITVILYAVYANRMNYRRIGFWAVIILLLLPALDPLSSYLAGGAGASHSGFSLDTLFQKRNFDGMSNLSLIASQQVLHPELMRVLTGARQPFMETFFPTVIESGVGFGSTIPGWFLLSGGMAALVVFSACYGVALELLNRWLRGGRSLYAIAGYLFAATWLMATGGNFIESVDKLLASITPAIIMCVRLRSRTRNVVSSGGAGPPGEPILESSK